MARRPAAINQSIDIEELPEADRLEGFAHPRDTRRLYGHERAEAQLAAGFRDGRMHHGWLISGREGIGKATLAYRFARHVLAKPDERDRAGATLDIPDDSTAARQVRALSHPGLLVLRRPYNVKDKRFAASIPIEETRRLKSFLGLSAGEGQWRVVIVDSADDLNINSANAILKSLEEPPPRTFFLLVTSAPGQLLPTIRSRVRTLELSALAPDDLRKAVVDASAAAGAEVPQGDAWRTLVELGQGSVRRVLGLSQSGGLAMHERVSALLAAMPKADWTEAHKLGDELGGVAAEQKFELFFDLLLDRLARLTRAAATGAGSDADRQLAGRIIGPARLATFAELWETIAREKAIALSINLDRKALILDTVARIEAAAKA